MSGITIEAYAAMRAEMDGGALRDEVLARAGITADQWIDTQQRYLAQMGDELEAGRFELTNRYTKAFVERQGALHSASSTPSAASPPDQQITMDGSVKATQGFAAIQISDIQGGPLPFSDKKKLRAPESAIEEGPHPDLGSTLGPGDGISPIAAMPFGHRKAKAYEAAPLPSPPKLPTPAAAPAPPGDQIDKPPSTTPDFTMGVGDVNVADIMPFGPKPEKPPTKAPAPKTPPPHAVVASGAPESPPVHTQVPETSPMDDPLKATLGLGDAFTGELISPFFKKEGQAPPPLATDLYRQGGAVAGSEQPSSTKPGHETLGEARGEPAPALPFAPAKPSETEAPKSARAPSVPPPAATEQDAQVALNTEQHASMCAELRVFPQASERVFARYGLADPAKRAKVDAYWNRRLAVDKSGYAKWTELYWRYVRYWTDRNENA